ncbi:hypothetical protein PVAP13_7NG365525 [Panicum virgatum]|uniref:Uncharacterized protein n=1 Tax=Panicum virgatum TaxID=38727 RepID=A0A8T0Q8Q8_PANVG|nr:hypothetical protein PVAP13_7NG365525 [Panicum virgatum]
MQSTKGDKGPDWPKKISSARIPGAQEKAAAVSPSSFKLEATGDVVPSEDKAPLALEEWGLASYSDEDEDEAVKAKPAAPKKGKSTGKPRTPSKDKYLLKKPAAQQDQKAKPEPEDQLMLGPAAGLGELLSSFDSFADAERADEKDAPAAPRDGAGIYR